MLAKLRSFLGSLWGATTTHLLALGIAVQPVLQTVDPSILSPGLKYTILAVAILVVVLRVVAPPPPSVTVEPEDAMHVNHADGIITITKDAPIPASVVSKAAEESSSS